MSLKLQGCLAILLLAVVAAEVHAAVAAPEKAPLQHPQAPLQHPQAPLQHPQAPLQHPQAPLQHPQAPAAAAASADASETFFERCPQGPDWIKFRGSCYQHFETPNYWLLAEEACKARSGHLVSIADAAENSFVAKLTYCREAWIGRYAVHADKLTEPDNYRWTDGTASQYHAHNFTNNPGLHHPLVSTADQTWRNIVYHGRKSYVCEVRAPQRNYTCDCPTGWKELGGYCYLMPQFEATYIEGDFYCRGRGAHVASLHTEAELRAMSLLDVESLGCPAETWIGLLKLNPCRVDFSTGASICYRWSDRSGDYKQFPEWQAGSPNQDKVTNCVLLKDREIRTVPCHTRARFVCKKKVEPVANARKCVI